MPRRDEHHRQRRVVTGAGHRNAHALGQVGRAVVPGRNARARQAAPAATRPQAPRQPRLLLTSRARSAPTIARYEIGDEVRQAFLRHDAGCEAAFSPTRPGHYLIDMPAIARRRLAAVGVSRVYGGALCTLADIRFYSHRREQRTGRIASLIWIA